MPNIFKNTRFDWTTPSSSPVDPDPISEPVAPVEEQPAPTGVRKAAVKTRRAAGRVASRQDFPLLAIWFGLGVLAVIVPAIARSRRMNQYSPYGYNNNYAQQRDYQYRYSADAYDYNDCKWWQINCQSYYSNGEAARERSSTPNWYSGWGSSEKQREQALQSGNSPASLIFVYVWQLLMFVGILAYGYHIITKRKPRGGLVGILAIWANMCFVTMWVLANGAITIDGGAMRDAGFYSQFAVLIFMTNFWYALFGAVFAVALGFFFMLEEEEEHVVPSNSRRAYKAPQAAPAPVAPTPATTTDEEYVRVV